MSLFYQFNSIVHLQQGYGIPRKILWDSNQGENSNFFLKLVLIVKLHGELRFVCEQEKGVVFKPDKLS